MTARLKGFLQPADAIVRCKACGAAVGEPCKPGKKKLAPGVVHFGRRVDRLLLTARAPEKRAALEAEAVALLLSTRRRAR